MTSGQSTSHLWNKYRKIKSIVCIYLIYYNMYNPWTDISWLTYLPHKNAENLTPWVFAVTQIGSKGLSLGCHHLKCLVLRWSKWSKNPRVFSMPWDWSKNWFAMIPWAPGYRPIKTSYPLIGNEYMFWILHQCVFIYVYSTNRFYRLYSIITILRNLTIDGVIALCRFSSDKIRHNVQTSRWLSFKNWHGTFYNVCMGR